MRRIRASVREGTCASAIMILSAARKSSAVFEVTVEERHGDSGFGRDAFYSELGQTIALNFERRSVQNLVTGHLSRLPPQRNRAKWLQIFRPITGVQDVRDPQQEARRVGTIDRAVIEGQGEHAH